MTKPYRPAAYSLIVMAVLAVTLQSCNYMFAKWVGMQEPELITETESQRFAGKLGIEAHPVFQLDTSFLELYRLPALNRAERQHLIQPVMILHFDSSGNLKQLSTNCSYPGVPRLQWNFNNEFESFPPALRIPVATSSGLAMTLRDFSDYCLPVNESAGQLDADGFARQDYLVILMGPSLKKQAKGLIRLIGEKYAGHQDQIIYVINENYQYYIHR